MISQGYDPRRVKPKVRDGRVDYVTDEYIAALGLSEPERTALMKERVAFCRCPPLTCFRATPEIIKLLRLDREPEASTVPEMPDDPAQGADDLMGPFASPRRSPRDEKKSRLLRELLRRLR